MNLVLKFVSELLTFIISALDRSLMHIFKARFKSFGKNALYHPLTSYIIGHHNISIGNFSTIGPKAIIYSYHSQLIIGNKSGIGPNCKIITGNHDTHIVGKLYKDYTLKDKLPEADLPVTLEDDVWVGAGVTILKGVTIGRGSVIGAGAVVTRSVPPYCIAVGNPAKVIKKRWEINEILEHESIVFPAEKRMSKSMLEEKLRNHA